MNFDYSQLVHAALRWKVAFFIVSAAAVVRYLHKMSVVGGDFSLALGLLAGSLALIFLVAFDVGRLSGMKVGFKDGLINGKFHGDYTIDLLRRHLAELERRVKKADSPSRSSRDEAVILENSDNSLPTGYGELMQLCQRVQDRYWHPDRLDISDPDTWPKQRDIYDWIKRERPGLSNAEVSAIEKVACPVKR